MDSNNNLFPKTFQAVDENLCFVLMPFNEEMDALYEDIIKPTVIELGMKCVRADEIYRVGSIMKQIWEHIQIAGLIIADLTGRNPNVLYELGLAHAFNKKVILLTQSTGDVLPFDISHLRCQIYDNTPRGVQKLKHSLIKTLETCQNEKPILPDYMPINNT